MESIERGARRPWKEEREKGKTKMECDRENKKANMCACAIYVMNILCYLRINIDF